MRGLEYEVSNQQGGSVLRGVWPMGDSGFGVFSL